jgi:hypothetical protein
MNLKFNLDSQSAKKTQYEVPSAGGSVARLYRIIDLGTQQTTYLGESKMTPQVMLVFELPSELTKDGKPMSISSIYTKRLKEKAKLRVVVKALTGTNITDDNVRNFNLQDLIGKVCTLDIINKTGKDGTVKAYVQNVSSALKGMPVPEPYNETLIFDLSEFNKDVFDKIPAYWQNKIQTTKEYDAVAVRHGRTDEVPF